MLKKHAFSAFVTVGVALMSVWSGAVRAQDPVAKYLSTDLADRLESIVQGWGGLGMNTSVIPLHKPAMTLRIKDKEYAHGLGHHASGEIIVDLSGQFQTFETEVGVQWQGGQDQATVIFRVFVDDKQVFDSGVMREGDAARPVKVSVAGAQELRLVADEAGDGITCDCANWAEARLVPDPNAAQRPPAMGVDIAPFGEIATWDPQRMTGTAANRVQELPAEDIRMHNELLPESDGTYRVPVAGGAGCIGVQWDENRLLKQVALDFVAANTVPATESIQLQLWSGESAWQGGWEPVQAAAEQTEHGLVWNLGAQSYPRGTQKVRWIFSDVKKPIQVRSPRAYSRTRWTTVDLRLEAPGMSIVGGVNIALYNGQFVRTADSTEDPYRQHWDPAQPLVLKVRTAVTRRYKADRTVLQFSEFGFGVAVEDVLANDCVYLADLGLFLFREPAPVTREEYLKKIAGRSTMLDLVRDNPDQTFAQALAVVHNPVQNFGPMMISLACDNRKFVAEREGTLLFNAYTKFDDPEIPIPNQWRLVPRYGTGTDQQVSRRLSGAWLPMPTTTFVEGDVAYEQCTYVAPLDDQVPEGSPAWVRDQAVAVVEYTASNNGPEHRPASFELTLAPGEGNSQQIVWEQSDVGVIARSGDRLLALLDVRELEPAEITLDAGKITITGELPPAAVARAVAYVPAWPAAPADAAKLLAAAPFAPRVAQYWTDVLAPATQVAVPDELLTNVIRASQVHCLLAARNEDAGRRVSPWISSDRYGPLESEANSIVRGMGMLGHDEFSQRSLDYFIRRYNEAGYLTTGYTMVGTGEHLWTLAEQYERVPNEEWLKANSAEIARMCKWIVAQRAKTKLLDARGQRVPEYGLFPPGVTADWNRYAYRFFNDAQYCAGLRAAARLLRRIEHPDAQTLAADADEYRHDLLTAYFATVARSPVVPLDDGTWVPADPALLDCPGRVEDFLPGEDGNRSWAYSVEIGAHHLVATGILDADDLHADWMMNYLEDFQLLRTGMGDYPEAKNRQDPYNFGGFGKVQPYYGRFAEVYAARDDLKPFIRAYFNAIPSLLSLENLSFWEHFHNIAGWNKTHETGWFLCQSRIMLVMERDYSLWLAPFAPRAWFQDGQQITVTGAPTSFGRVSYTIKSAVAQNYIEATIKLENHAMEESLATAAIALRLRHPEGKLMQKVTVNGEAQTDFDAHTDIVTITVPGLTKKQTQSLSVRVEY